MDLRNFRETSRPAVNKSGFFEKQFARLKYWVLPPTNDKRKERYTQYQDVGLFIGAIAVVAYF